jgi:rubrerythrin
MRRFDSLSEPSAQVFEGMREEESGHRRRLIELFRQKFGEHIPLIRRQDKPAPWK